MKYAEGIISYSYKYAIIWNNKDILIEDGKFLSYLQFSLKYNITNAFLLYAGMVNNYKRQITNDPIYKDINVLQRPNSNFESSCFSIRYISYLILLF